MKYFYLPALLFLLSFPGFAQWTDVGSERLDLVFLSPTQGWMAGAGGIIQKTTDGGQTWVNLSSPAEGRRVERIFVFNGGTTLRIVVNNNSARPFMSYLYTSRDGGQTWTQDVIHRNELINAYFVTESVGWYWGNIALDEYADPQLFHTTDGGATWTVDNSGYVGNMFNLGNTVWKTVYAGGKGYLDKSTDLGATWVRTNLPSNSIPEGTLQFLDDQNGWYSSKVSNSFFRTADGGQTWTPARYNAKTTNYVQTFRFLNATTGYLLADEDLDIVLKTTDGGGSWQPVYKVAYADKYALNNLYFTDANHGAVIGSNGLYLRTTDGASFTRNDHCNAGENYEASHVGFSTNGTAWVSGFGILHSSTDGHHWTRRGDVLDGGVNGSIDFRSMAFTTGGKGMLMRNAGSFYFTEDNGATWTFRQTSFEYSPDYNIESIWYDLAGNAWAIGVNGTLYRSVNGGKFTIQYAFKPAIVGTLTLVCQSDKKIWVFEDANRVLRSQDGGETWTLQREYITAMQFLTPDIGYKILEDNSFHQTNDGGTTWTKLSTVGNSYNIYPHLYMADPYVGWLIDGSGATRKTTDGGKTWKTESSGIAYAINDVAFRKNDQGKIEGYMVGRSVTKFTGDYTPRPIIPPVVDKTAPTLSGTHPTHQGKLEDTATPLVLTFSEPVKATLPVQVRFAYSNNGIVSIIPFQLTTANTVINGSQVTIQAGEIFPSAKQVSVLINATTFYDLAGNAYTGIADLGRWSFTTPVIPDEEAPELLSTLPANGAQETTPVEALVLSFNEPVVVAGGTLEISTVQDGTPVLVMDLTGDNTTMAGATLTVHMPQALPGNGKFRVAVSAGTVTDASGNIFPGLQGDTWRFATKQIVLGVEEPGTANSALRLTRTGSEIVVTLADNEGTILGISDMIGRNLPFTRTTHTSVTLPKPSGVFIVTCRQQNSVKGYKYIVE